MITEIELNNFQSHEYSKLKLDSGINAIIGDTDKGKTAILRALYWCMYNRPSGISFVSNWVKEDKILNDECSVTIHKNGTSVQRCRDKNFNGYFLFPIKDNFDDVTKLEAIKTDVPEEVNDFLNLSEINIQKQMEQPFLLSSTPGEVARVFNKTINLDIIDHSLKISESRRREYKKKEEEYSNRVIDYQKELDKLNWIDELKPLINAADDLENRISEKSYTIEVVSSFLKDYNYFQEQIEKIKPIISLQSKVDEALNIHQELKTIQNSYHGLEILLEQRKTYVQKICIDFDDLESLIEEAISCDKRIQMKNITINSIKNSLIDLEDYKKSIEKLNTEIEDLKTKLPETCPTCGGPFNRRNS